MMRITRNGAACSRQRDQTPSASSALTDPSSRALVRTSDAVGDLATSAVSTLADASAIAAVRPAGPAPTTATSAVKRFMPQPPSKRHSLLYVSSRSISPAKTRAADPMNPIAELALSHLRYPPPA